MKSLLLQLYDGEVYPAEQYVNISRYEGHRYAFEIHQYT